MRVEQLYELIAVTAANEAAQTVLRNLAKMYCCEWSQYTGMDVDELGRYAFEKYVPRYWDEPERKAFLLRCSADRSAPKWAGFALMDRDFCIHKDYDHSMAEFFVLPKYRRHGAGHFMAAALFDRFPGKWELGRNPKNRLSYDFWEHVIRSYTGGRYALICASPAHRYIDGTLGDVFSFDNSANATQKTEPQTKSGGGSR